MKEIARRLIDGVWRTGVADENGNGNGGSQPDLESPLDLDDCVLWLDASQLALADDAAVATWPDSSPSGFDATQADVAKQPICKTAVLNGLRVVRFAYPFPDIQYLELSGAALGLVRNLDGCTVAYVAANPTTTSNMIPFVATPAASTSSARLRAEYHGDGVASIFADNSAGGGESNFALIPFSKTAPVAAVGAVDYARGGITIHPSMSPTGQPDGQFNDTPGPTPDTDSQAIFIGADPDNIGGSDCDYGEIIVYNRALNARERRQLLEYLSSKWATL